jgi:hypothetical protein
LTALSQCYFRHGNSHGKIDCDLDIEIENFGNIFITEKLRENCLVFLPKIKYGEFEAGTQGGTKVVIYGDFSSLKTLTFEVNGENMEIIFIENDNVSLIVPKLKQGHYFIDIKYEGLAFIQLPLSISMDYDSYILSSLGCAKIYTIYILYI